MDLPESGELSLREAIDLIVRECRVDDDRAQNAIVLACAAGDLTARGDTPLSAHSDQAKRLAHPVWKTEKLDIGVWNPAASGGRIKWSESTVGNYQDVRLARAELWSWLTKKPGETRVTAKRKIGAPTEKDRIRAALEALPEEDFRRPLARLAEVVTERCGKKIGDKRWSQRTVERHVSRYLQERQK